MKRYLKRILIIALITFLLFIVFILSREDNKYIAIYYTSNNSSEINDNNLKKQNILYVNSFEKMKNYINGSDKNIGILLDKSIIDKLDGQDDVSRWVKQQQEHPIIVIGYSNPTFVFFKKLDITDGKYLPKLSDEQYAQFSKKGGYCISYTAKDGIIYGNGYEGKIDLHKIKKLITELSIENCDVSKIIKESNKNE